MRLSTIDQLNQLNKDFYRDIASDFSQTRNKPWQGWIKIGQYLKSLDQNKLTILDIGCGNGRFAGFIQEVLVGKSFSYLGIDSDKDLLSDAKTNFESSSITFTHSDLYTFLDQEHSEMYDFIGVFGVMHHIPSYEKRIDVIQALTKLLSNNGILALSFWKFAEYDRFTNKQIQWVSYPQIDQNDLEENDYLLNWQGSDKPRYAHYFSEDEINSIIKDTDLEILDNYRADGKNEKLNQYLILSKTL